MLSTLLILPFPFWLAVFFTIVFSFRAWSLRESSIGIPMLVVLLTSSFWYFGDVLYNDYTVYQGEVNKNALEAAWMEVLIFVVAFGLIAPWLHGLVNRKYLRRPSIMLKLVHQGGITLPKYQKQIDTIFTVVFVVWLIMMTIALFRTDFDFVGLFAPYLSEKVDPWGRGRVGTGFDSLLAAAAYIQIGIVAMFGVIAALSSRSWTGIMARLICLLMMPGYIFDRTRSTMLVILLPGFLALIFLRLRVPMLVKVILLILGFFALENWLKFVIESRGEQTITEAFIARMNSTVVDPAAAKHLGLNMFEELGFINDFFDDGSFRPGWGEEYFSEMVNPIPRTIWPGKPLIGIDYALARGLSFAQADEGEAGVGATISTGIVGQGVVNFGRFLGPVVAALLISLWIAFLARQDILGEEIWRLLLYVLGLILTFNMGRDITLLVTYPFVFGFIGFFILRHYLPSLKVPLMENQKRERITVSPGLALRRQVHQRT